MKNNISYIYRNNHFIKSKVGAVIIGVIIIIVVIMFFPHFFRNTYKVTVTNKQIIKRNNVDTYFIYTQMENGKIKVFENTNNLLELKFNSSDLYFAMAIDKKYEVKAYGLSIPSLASYQNIKKVKGIAK
jgi:hypothetical protein